MAAVVGAIAGAVVSISYNEALGPLAAWDAAALVYIVSTWLIIWPLSASETARHAATEDPTRAAADTAVLLASVASLAAVAVVIADSHAAAGPLQRVEIGVSVASVVISWVLVHTLFTLRYARMYYGGGEQPEGGVDFEDHVRPPYSDFAYLSFTIGMTFQVSDTDLQSVAFRRLALRHELLSYLFGAVILASTINLIAGLVH